MNPYDDAASLSRTHEKADLSKLATQRFPSHQTRRKRSISRPSLGRTESGGSENSQALYMTPKKRTRRNHGRSLSTWGNGPSRKLEGSIDEKLPVQNYTTAAASATAEDLSWNVIDREISEWQYVCETGRPYWWSPETKTDRLKRAQSRFSNESRLWMKDIDQRPQPGYSRKRKAVTDTYLADPAALDNVQDLAHLIAVQLLGACFTLPPDCIVGIPAPAYTIVNRSGGTQVGDPRLISSLRMHTHFRYTPSFGHHARSSSPVSVWPGIYDGPSVNPFPNGSRSSALDVVGDSAHPSQRLSPRRYHIAAAHETPEQNGDHKITTDRSGKASVSGFPSPDLQATNLPDPRESRNAHQRYGRISKGPRDHKNPANEGRLESAESCQGTRSVGSSAKTNYRLQPMIDSKPHHLLVPPVKELVVKRWRTFRRRLSGSLHGVVPARASEEQSSASESDATGPNSPVMSSDSRRRRLRAQERGDIHSSTDSTQHYNTPASRAITPNGSEVSLPYDHDTQTVTSLPDLSARLAVAKTTDSDTSSSTPSGFTKPQSLGLRGSSQYAPSSALATCNTTRSRSDFSPGSAIAAGAATRSEFPFSPLPGSRPPSTANSVSSRRVTPRQRRKSTLSEVHTPEDFLDVKAKLDRERSIFSAIGSALPSPHEDEVGATITRQLDGVLTSPGPVSFLELDSAKEFPLRQRPKLSRTTSSGTQVFTPNDEGVEIDGLPVGPEKDAWTGKKGGEAAYL